MTTAAPPPSPSDAAAPRVVIALDVDGVLNAGVDGDGSVAHELHMPAETLPKSPFLRGYGRQDLTGSVRLRPEHAAWIASVRERADVVWATTWEDAANTHLAPLLGIDPLPVGISTETHPPRFGHAKNGDSAAWKATALADEFAGRPLVWLDDSAHWYTHDSYANYDAPWRPEPTLVLVPDERVGLTAEHIAAVEAFLLDPVTPTPPPLPDWDDED